MELLPSEVRARVLADHDHLRGHLDATEAAADAVLRSEPGATPEMRGVARRLEAAWRGYLEVEDRILVPALAEADAWGEVRVRRLAAEQDKQRLLLARVAEVASGGEPEAGARTLRDVIEELRRELEREERDVLHPNLLRDDPVMIHFTG